MVFNTTKHIKLPFSNATMQAHSNKIISKLVGGGMGSVLLQKGGPGAGSSYMDMDDYIATTGINPYARSGVIQKKGSGFSKPNLSKLSDKLSKLNVVPDGVKRKNITMSF